MRKWFSISKQQAPFLVTVVILVLLGVGYIYIYIPKNEKALEEQHFRWLQRIDKNIRVKIQNSDTLLAVMLRAYLNPDFSRDSVKKVIDRFPRTNYTLSDTVIQNAADSLINKISENSGPLFSIKTNDDQTQFVISAAQRCGKSSICRISMSFRFDLFITPILPKEIFDHYVVFYKKHYVYEDFHSGLAYQDEDSLLQIKRGITGATITDQNVGGVDYKMFLQPIYLDGNEQFIVAGLHSLKKYNAEKKRLPTEFSLFLITIAIAIFVFIPWIRIYFMSASDRLKLSDVAGSVLVAKFLMALLVFFFFKYNYHFIDETGKGFSRKNLADSITAAFRKESKNAYQSLAGLDSLMKIDSLHSDIKNIGNTGIQRLKSASAFTANKNENYEALSGWLKDTVENAFKKFQFTEVNWLDAKGDVKFNWSSRAFNNSHTNYSYRPYFRNINNEKALQIDGDTFSMEPVVSGTNGSFQTVISKRSILNAEGNRMSSVIAMSFRMKCLDTVVMPAGYSFIVVNNNAEVLYHSDSTRNLNENLMEEFSEKGALADALQGRFSGIFSTEYYENNYMVRADPMKGFPYFIIIMNDVSFAGNAEIEIFSFTWGMIFLFVFVALIDIIILVFSSSRRSYFKKQFLITSWLWPRRSSQDEYVVATLGNTIIIVFLLLIYFLQLFTYPVFFFALIFSIPILTIFLNGLFLKKYRALKNEVFLKYKIRCARWNRAFLLMLNVLALCITGASFFYTLFIFELCIFGLYLLIIKQKKYLSAWLLNKVFPRGSSYISGYTCMIFTRLLITCGIPVIFFYTSSYNYEQNLLARYREFDFAKQLKKKFGNNTEALSVGKNNAVYKDGYWVDSFYVIEKKKLDSITAADEYSLKDNSVAGAFRFLGWQIWDLPSDNDNFYKKHSDDSSVIYNDFFKDVLYRDSGSGKTFLQLNNPSRYLGVNSVAVKYELPSLRTIKGAAFWIMLLVFLALLFLLLKAIVKKIFAVNMPRLNDWNNIDQYVLQHIQHYKRAFIVGLPGSGKMQQTIKVLRSSFPDLLCDQNAKVSNTITVVDIRQLVIADEDKRAKILADVIRDQYKFIIIDHFDAGAESISSISNAFKLMHKILHSAKDKIVVILSSKEPAAFIHALQNNAEAEPSFDEQLAANWRNLLSGFPVVVIPLAITKKMDDAAVMEKVNAVESLVPVYLQQSVDEETRHAPFLDQLRPALVAANEKADYKQKRQTVDLLSLQLQVTAYNYYTCLWHCLSDEEKFIMYDLAEEGLVNTKNFFSVNMLISKGLIIEEDGNLHIFNRSFRNFIVTSIGQNEAEKINRQISTGSNWNKLQGPLLIAILAILAFLLISQEGTYSRLVAIISGLATGIPALVKIFSGLNMPVQKGGKSPGLLN
ncbi:MAG: hypothetical protein QM802_21540 [Agriterribacter sp.]